MESRNASNDSSVCSDGYLDTSMVSDCKYVESIDKRNNLHGYKSYMTDNDNTSSIKVRSTSRVSDGLETDRENASGESVSSNGSSIKKGNILVIKQTGHGSLDSRGNRHGDSNTESGNVSAGSVTSNDNCIFQENRLVNKQICDGSLDSRSNRQALLSQENNVSDESVRSQEIGGILASDLINKNKDNGSNNSRSSMYVHAAQNINGNSENASNESVNTDAIHQNTCLGNVEKHCGDVYSKLNIPGLDSQNTKREIQTRKNESMQVLARNDIMKGTDLIHKECSKVYRDATSKMNTSYRLNVKGEKSNEGSASSASTEIPATQFSPVNETENRKTNCSVAFSIDVVKSIHSEKDSMEQFKRLEIKRPNTGTNEAEHEQDTPDGFNRTRGNANSARVISYRTGHVIDDSGRDLRVNKGNIMHVLEQPQDVPRISHSASRIPNRSVKRKMGIQNDHCSMSGKIRRISSWCLEAPNASLSEDSSTGIDTGFVDANQKRGSNFSNTSVLFHPDLFSKYDTRSDMNVHDFKELLSRETNPQVCTAICQTLADIKLPELASKMQIHDIAQCLGVSDSTVQDVTTSLLEKLLIEMKRTQDDRMTNELLNVAQITQTAFLRLNDTDTQMYVLFYIHVLAAVALLCRCPLPTREQCSALIQAPKNYMAKTMYKQCPKYNLLKAMQVFYEHFQDQLDKPSLYRKWNKVVAGQREDFRGANFCHHLVYMVSIFCEISVQGWSPTGLELIKTLRHLYEAGTRTAKMKKCSATKAAFDFMLIRGLTNLLNTTFKKDREKVGEQSRGHPKLIADLMLEVIMENEEADKSCLYNLIEVSSLPFHSNEYVKNVFGAVLQSVKHPRDLALNHIENSLKRFGFEQNTHQMINYKGTEIECTWNPFTCTFNGGKAQGAVYVSKYTCMTRGKFGTCLADHPGMTCKNLEERERITNQALRHKQNLKCLLRLSRKSENIVKLLAFQVFPFPFYITEDIEEYRLLSYLLDLGKDDWLNLKDIATILLQILKAIIFLDQNDIVSRDITAYNLLIKSGNNVSSDGSKFIIKIADLGLSHTFRSSRNNGNIIRIQDHGAIPLRWTAPEALLYGLYSDRSMVYSLGMVMYEVCTHGCQPFTEYDQKMSIEELMKEIMFAEVKPKLTLWHCKRVEMYSLIRRCTDYTPENRPWLQELEIILQELCLAVPEESSPKDLDKVVQWEESKPVPTFSQKSRNHKPETGITSLIQDYIDEYFLGKRIIRTDKNRKGSRWIERNKICVSDEELTPHDYVKVQFQSDHTIVTERLSKKFVMNELPMLEASQLEGINCWLNDDRQMTKPTMKNGKQIQIRRYKPCQPLEKYIGLGELWNVSQDHYDQADTREPLIPMLTSIAQVICNLHEKGWIHRDLRLENICVDYRTGQVILLNIGRMRQIVPPEKFVLDKPFEECIRCLAPEVLQGGKYGPENDIFMLGTLIWQVYRIRELTLQDINCEKRDYMPCNDVPKENVPFFVQEGTSLPIPVDCPDWIVKLYNQCRHPDPSQRPTIQKVVSSLLCFEENDYPQMPFLSHLHFETQKKVETLVWSPVASLQRNWTNNMNSIRRTSPRNWTNNMNSIRRTSPRNWTNNMNSIRRTSPRSRLRRRPSVMKSSFKRSYLKRNTSLNGVTASKETISCPISIARSGSLCYNFCKVNEQNLISEAIDLADRSRCVAADMLKSNKDSLPDHTCKARDYLHAIYNRPTMSICDTQVSRIPFSDNSVSDMQSSFNNACDPNGNLVPSEENTNSGCCDSEENTNSGCYDSEENTNSGCYDSEENTNSGCCASEENTNSGCCDSEENINSGCCASEENINSGYSVCHASNETYVNLYDTLSVGTGLNEYCQLGIPSVQSGTFERNNFSFLSQLSQDSESDSHQIRDKDTDSENDTYEKCVSEEKCKTTANQATITSNVPGFPRTILRAVTQAGHSFGGEMRRKKVNITRTTDPPSYSRKHEPQSASLIEKSDELLTDSCCADPNDCSVIASVSVIASKHKSLSTNSHEHSLPASNSSRNICKNSNWTFRKDGFISHTSSAVQSLPTSLGVSRVTESYSDVKEDPMNEATNKHHAKSLVDEAHPSHIKYRPVQPKPQTSRTVLHKRETRLQATQTKHQNRSYTKQTVLRTDKSKHEKSPKSSETGRQTAHTRHYINARISNTAPQTPPTPETRHEVVQTRSNSTETRHEVIQTRSNSTETRHEVVQTRSNSPET